MASKKDGNYELKIMLYVGLIHGQTKIRIDRWTYHGHFGIDTYNAKDGESTN